MKMEIALITDFEYVVPTLVTIRSIKSTMEKNSFFRLNILYDALDECTLKLFEQERCDNFDIVFFECKKRIEQLSFQHPYVSKASILKFFLPDILEKTSKVLYVDSDILFKKDISSLFSIDINEYYVCAVKDMKCTKEGDPERLGITNYFNSGVMLLNLEKMRKESIPIKLLEYKNTLDSGKYMDQDALNYVLSRNVKFIDPEFNMIETFFTFYSESEIDEFYGVECRLSAARIIHFAGVSKPWNDFDNDYYKEWISYLTIDAEMSFFVNSFAKAFLCLKNNYNSLWDINEKREQQIKGIDSELDNQSKKLMQLMDKEIINDKRIIETERMIASVSESINETEKKIDQLSIWKIIRNSFHNKK